MIRKIYNKIQSKLSSSISENLFQITRPPGYISPETICKENSVEVLCGKAEKYFQNVTDPFPFISRPFANFSKSPDSIISLGALLSGLHLGKTMKVLEFGAGVCWLSRLLNQMGASTISVDCSMSAIKTGEKLFKDYPIIGEFLEEPQFNVFDGHQLDIADKAVDRIVCFDAFHHVQNIDEILNEFYRVLKDGGIAGFAEPGLCHSFASQSQTEMRNYGVLERDIRLEELKEISEKIGFTKLYVKLSGNTEISYSEYRKIVDTGTISDRIENHITTENRNRTIFFLQKGDLQADSRNGHGLKSRIKLKKDVQNIDVKAGETINLQLSIKNIGIAKWIHQNVQDLGVVKVGGHLFDDNFNMIEIDYLRTRLEKDIMPGETCHSQISFNAPEKNGKYIIGIDMVSEHICWFENCGSQAIIFNLLVSDT